MRDARFPWRDRALIALSAFALCTAWIVALPPWQGPDEPAHYAYIERISHGALPELDHGPLRFSAALGTSANRALRSFRIHQDRPLTEESQSVLIGPEPAGLSTVGNTASAATTYPPLYYALVLPFYAVGGDTATQRLYSVRVGSALLASIFAVLTALLVFDATRSRRLALTSGLLAVLPPMLCQAGAIASPDVLLTCATAWSILAIRRVRAVQTRGRWVSAALALLAVSLSKPVGTAVAVALLAAFAGGDLYRLARQFKKTALAIAVVAVPVLAVIGHRLYATHAILENPVANTRLAASYLWQFYLPRLSFMHPIFADSVLSQPVPVWGTFVRTGIGYFGWISAPMPDWSYVVIVLGTAAALGIAFVAARRTGLGAGRDGLIFMLLLLLIVHIAEFGVYRAGGGTILQGRYLLPAIPAGLLLFMAPLARASERVQTTAIAVALATWGLATVVGLATALEFYAT